MAEFIATYTDAHALPPKVNIEPPGDCLAVRADKAQLLDMCESFPASRTMGVSAGGANGSFHLLLLVSQKIHHS